MNTNVDMILLIKLAHEHGIDTTKPLPLMNWDELKEKK